MSLTYQLTLNRDAVKFVSKQEKTVQERIRKSAKPALNKMCGLGFSCSTIFPSLIAAPPKL